MKYKKFTYYSLISLIALFTSMPGYPIPKEQFELHISNPDAVISLIKMSAENRKIITFLGYSGLGYENPKRLDDSIKHALRGCTPSLCRVINACSRDVSRVAQIAGEMGLSVDFVTSSVVEDHIKTMNPNERKYIERTFIFQNPLRPGGWERRPEGFDEGVPTPMAYAMIGAADQIVMIGGGFMAIEELQIAEKLGKKVDYYPARYNPTNLFKMEQEANVRGEVFYPPPHEYGASYLYVTNQSPYSDIEHPHIQIISDEQVDSWISSPSF